MMIFYIWGDIELWGVWVLNTKMLFTERDSGILKSKVGGNLAVPTIISQ